MPAVVTIAPTDTGAPDEVDRILDAVEAKTGWSGERDGARWICTIPDSTDIFDAERQVVDVLQRVAPGWQDHILFER